VFGVAFIVALLVGLVFHEFCHAIVATWLGDDTPRLTGRLTFNPLAHLDPFGTFLMLLAGFGWAKPVQVNAYRLRNGPTTGMAVVAAAGPISNFVMAGFFSLPLLLGWVDNDFPALRGNLDFDRFTLSNFVALVLFYVVTINVTLGVFNLIPLAPLDGSRVAVALLPGRAADFFRQMEPYGMGILFLIFIISTMTPVNILGAILNPIQRAVQDALLR
jgi:Zn-dependent protease